jgi:tRNA(Ile)-lysidine synthase
LAEQRNHNPRVRGSNPCTATGWINEMRRDGLAGSERSSFFFMELFDRFHAFCLDLSLFSPGDRILLGVSGGPDSMVLFDLFLRMRESMTLSLAVAHLHHGLRGTSADGDEAFVAAQCSARKIPFYSRRENVPDFAATGRRSIEEAGRILRFRFFRELIENPGFEKIALGHHADDNAETVLLNLFRGAGLRGARGIRPSNGRVIHPILFATRDEIVAYAAFREIEYRADPSNRERNFRRNRIRQDIMEPLKLEFGRSIVNRIGRFAGITDEALQFIDHEAESAFDRSAGRGPNGEILLDIFPLLSYFKAVQKSVLYRIFRELLGEEFSLTADEYARILSLAEKGKSGRRLKVSGMVHVVCSGERLVFFRNLPAPAGPIPVSPGEWIPLDGNSRIRVEIQRMSGASPKRADWPFAESMDGDKIRYPLVVRRYRTGDRFVPLGMKSPKKLKRFFIDEKIPNFLRDRIPILSDAEGPVWIIGHRIADRVKITPETKTVLKAEAALIHEHQTVTG